MQYRDNPIYGTLFEVVGDIGRVATNGDYKAAMIDLVAAASEGAITAYGVRKEERAGKHIDSYLFKLSLRGFGSVFGVNEAESPTMNPR